MRHINCITFTNRGMLIIGLSFDGILLWDWVAGLETTFSIGNDFSEVLTVSAATTGKVLCLLSDGNVYLMSETFDIIHTWYTCWQPSAGDTKRTRSNLHLRYLGRVHFTHNGKIMAVIDNERSNSIHVHDAESGALIQSLSAPGGQMFYEVTASDECLLLATVGSSSPLGERSNWDDVIMEAFIWDLNGTNVSASHSSPRVISSVHCQRPTINQHGLLAYTGDYSYLKIWNILKDPPELVHTLDYGTYVSFSPDGQHLIAEFNAVKIINTNALGFVKHASNCTTGIDDSVGMNRQSLSPDGLRLAIVSSRGKITLWHIGSENEEMGSEVAILDTPWEVPTKVDDGFATAWSSNGAFLAVASSAGFVVYDCSARHPAILKSVSYEYEPSSLDDTWRQLLFSPCGSSIAITNGDMKRVSLWNFPSCTCRWLQALQDPKDCQSAMTIQFSPDGAQLAVSHGYNARLMDSNTGATIWTRSFASLNVRFIDSLAFSSSGALMAIKAFQIDRKPSNVESGSGRPVNSEQKSFDKSPVNIQEMADYGSVKRLFVTNVANGRHVATMSEGIRLKTNASFGQMAYVPGDDFVVCQDTWFSNVNVARKESSNPIPQNVPCNIMMVRYGYEERWLTKFGRRLVHCPSSIAHGAAPHNWVLFPHRLHGYDSTRIAPFTIELACPQCSS